jgi:hypothetical protein
MDWEESERDTQAVQYVRFPAREKSSNARNTRGASVGDGIELMMLPANSLSGRLEARILSSK